MVTNFQFSKLLLSISVYLSVNVFIGCKQNVVNGCIPLILDNDFSMIMISSTDKYSCC